MFLSVALFANRLARQYAEAKVTPSPSGAGTSFPKSIPMMVHRRNVCEPKLRLTLRYMWRAVSNIFSII